MKNRYLMLAVALFAFECLGGAGWAQTFVEQTNIVLTGVSRSSVAWGDYDNDGDLDILLTGYTAGYPARVSKLYRNNSDRTFTEQTNAAFRGVGWSSVAWGDYDNDSDLDVLLMGSPSSGSYISSLYRNDGTNGFTAQTNVALAAVSSGAVAWGDCDNDGDLDILLTGDASGNGSAVTRLYLNDGQGGFREKDAMGLTPVFSSSVAWGDYDNDGDLDILLAGNDTPSPTYTKVSKIYRNEGDGRYDEQTGIDLPGVENGSVAWGDYDNDGDLDLLLTGASTNGNIAKIYRNNGGVGFTELSSVALPGVFLSSVKWGDYDNDGDLDILLAGSAAGGIARIYRNNGDDTFTEQAGILPGVSFACVDWGDYDNDGDLDILLTGETSGSVQISKVFRNNGAVSNHPPAAPTACVASMVQGKLHASWPAAGDDRTPAAGLSYNLIIQSTTGGMTRGAAMSNPANGWRQIARIGPIQGTQWTWTPAGTPSGSYRFTVQALDAALAGSPFASWSAPVSVIAVPNNITASDGWGGLVQVSWAMVSGAEAYEVWRGLTPDPAAAVHLSAGADPVITNYHDVTGALDVHYYYWVRARAQGQTSAFAQPDLGFRGRFIEQANSGIPDVCDGSADWGDYDNDGDQDLLLTGDGGTGGYLSRIYRNNGDGTFTNSGVVLPGIYLAAASWGDYNNDGHLDILMAGCNQFVGGSNPHITRIYRNDGAGGFADAGTTLPGVHSPSLAWGDYDNDGRLDFVLAGESGLYPFTKICKLYRNMGDVGFVEQTDVELPAFSSGTIAWGDCDNDGDLDLLLAGWTGGFGKAFNIYRNDGNNHFTVLAGPGASGCSAAWGDYDNDGDLDVLVAGDFGENARFTFVYRNDGSNTLWRQTNIVLMGMADGTAAWGDCDNDGDLDILLNGWADGGPWCIVYRNDGGNVFTDITAAVLPGFYGGQSRWVDYNLDGNLDLFLSGNPGKSPYRASRLYRNDTATSNTPPAASAGVTAALVDGRLRAAWLPCLDAQTPSSGLSYNVRIRPVSGSGEWGAPMSAAGGWHRVTRLGPVQGTNWSWCPVGVPCGGYRIAIQALDSLFAASPFAEAPGVVTLLGAPGNIQASDGDGGHPARVDVIWSPVAGAESYEVWRNTTADPASAQHISSGNDPVTPAFSDASALPWQKYYYWVRTRALGQTSAFGVPDSGYTGGFTEQTNVALCAVSGASLAWADCDRDGFLDLLLAGYGGTSTGYVAKVYRNDGHGGLHEINAGLPRATPGRAWWTDYNNDNIPDVFFVGNTDSRVYRGEGDGTFTLQPRLILPGLSSASSAWGDYNNDGRLDILLTGYLGSPSYARISRVYRNQGNGTFMEQTNIVLKGIELGSVAWGDYDNDGNLDILLAGRHNSYSRTMLYRNNGDETFTEQTAISLTGADRGSVDWGDYDNDGDWDILLTGFVTTYTFTFKVYRNNGNGTFTELLGSPAVMYSAAKWGDFDNDGDLDILLTGDSSNSGNAPVAYIYRNLGADVFVRQESGAVLAGIQNGAIAWGDYDNDGDLDIALVGDASLDSAYVRPIAKLYRNNGPVSNTPPAAPGGLLAALDSHGVATLSWQAATDIQTASTGLCYNLRVGSLPGEADVVTPLADTIGGQRRLPGLGNAGPRRTHTLQGLHQDRTYYWSVQAIDPAFAGGAWAAEGMFGSADTDYDGMPDDWENAHGLMVGVNDARLHGDNDGVDNISEYVANTHPQDGLVYFHVADQAFAGDRFSWSWTAASGRFYSVACSSNILNGVWHQLDDYLTNGCFEVVLQTNTGALYYRLGLRLQ